MPISPRHVSLVAGVAILTMAGMIWVAAKQRGQIIKPGAFPSRHPVTSDELARAEKLTLKPFVPITGTDTFGTKFDLEKYRAGRPAVVVFILGKCPCSLEAQNLFNELQTNYSDDVRFVGVCKGDLASAKQFVAEASVNFPVVADDGTIAKAYDAKKSVYTALVGADGKIIKVYPGYGKMMAADLNDKLAKLIGQMPKPIPSMSILPKEDSAGCDLFEETPPSVK